MELSGGGLVALLLLFFALSSVQATSLIQALQNAGASQFAAEIQANPAASAIYFSNRVQTVFAPTDGSTNSSTSKLRRRQSDPAALQRLLYHCTANINTLAAMSFGSGLAMMSNDNSPQLGGKSQEFVSTPVGKPGTNSCPSQQLVDRNSNDTDWPWWPWHTVYIPTSIYVTVPVTVYISVPVTEYVSVYITIEDTQTVYIKAPTTVLTTLLATVHETDFITFSTTQVTTVHDTNSVTISTTVVTTVHDTDSITISNIEVSTVHDTYSITISNLEVTTVHETGFVTLTTTDFITVPTTEVTTVLTTVEETSLVTVPTTDFSTVPTTEVITLEQTATITIPTTLLSTVPTTVVTTQISTFLSTVPTTIVTTQFSTIPTTVFTTQFSTVPTTVPTTIATTVSTDVPTTVLSTISTELSTTIFSTVHDTKLVTVSTEIPTTIVSTVTSKVPTTVSTVVTTRLLPTATPSLVKISSGLGNSVNVIQADIPYDGGIIHIIDDSFTLPESLTDTANVNGQTAFTGLASSYNLTNTLDNTPEITYFIPSNSAFAIQGATSSYPSIESLLLGHLIPSFAGYLPSLSDGSTYKSQAGSEFTVTIKGTDYYINNAKIILANVIVANGVAHVIDQVIQPLATQTAHPSSGSSLRDEPLRLMILGWSIVMFLLGFVLL